PSPRCAFPRTSLKLSSSGIFCTQQLCFRSLARASAGWRKAMLFRAKAPEDGRSPKPSVAAAEVTRRGSEPHEPPRYLGGYSPTLFREVLDCACPLALSRDRLLC